MSGSRCPRCGGPVESSAPDDWYCREVFCGWEDDQSPAHVDVSQRSGRWVVQLVNGEHVTTLTQERVRFRAVDYARAAALIRELPLIVDGVRIVP
jgi:hypothetical protein